MAAMSDNDSRIANCKLIGQRLPDLKEATLVCIRALQFGQDDAERRYRNLARRALQLGQWSDIERNVLLHPPGKPTVEKRSVNLTLRFTPSEKARIKAAAKEHGMSVTDWVLHLTDTQVRRSPELEL
jgi:hypothetical protein